MLPVCMHLLYFLIFCFTVFYDFLFYAKNKKNKFLRFLFNIGFFRFKHKIYYFLNCLDYTMLVSQCLIWFDLPQVTPDSLYMLTALLVQHNIIQLADVYPLVSWPFSQFSLLAVTVFLCEDWLVNLFQCWTWTILGGLTLKKVVGPPFKVVLVICRFN